MKFTLYCLALLFTASSAAWALTYSSSEGVFVHHLAGYASIYAIQHEGRAPASWSDVETLLDRPIDAAYRDITPTKRYTFLPQSLPLPPPHEGDLLVITRRPFRDRSLYWGFFGISRGLREPGRYIIYRTKTGEFRDSFVDEAYVQQAFRGFEFLLPTPDSEPLRTHEMEALWRSISTWIISIIAAGLFVRRFMRWPPTRANTISNG